MKPSSYYHIRYFHLRYAMNVEVKGRVLDVGCGGAELTDELQGYFKKSRFTGCDLYPKKKSIIKSDAHKLKFKNNSFSTIFMFDVLEHLKSPQKALSEIRRVLKPGGVYHLVIPLEASLMTFDGWIKILFNVNLKKLPIGHINQFNFIDIKNLLSREGFKIKKIGYSYYYAYQIMSFIYFFYANNFKKGKYVPLLPNDKRNNLHFLAILIKFGGLIINIENWIWSSLGIPGQTIHITSIKSPYKFTSL